jgi:elongation of very long chain fatty acids protein 6
MASELFETARYWVELQWLEKYHDWRGAHVWMTAHYEVPLVLSAGYFVVIFAVQHIMKERKPFDLAAPLFWWNFLLAAFSILGAISTIPYIVYEVITVGVSADMCSFNTEAVNPWVYLFCLSKIPELVDTLFIVLRKRPLIFLHYYHHALTLIYAWSSWATLLPSGGWFAGMNLIVHSLMYSYYAACARGVRFSQATRQAITSLQILQMVAGTSIMVHNVLQCNDYPIMYAGGLLMYVSYMVLFSKLFVDSYINVKPRAPREKETAGARKVPKKEE